MNPLKKRTITKYKKKNPADKKLFQNLWKQMVYEATRFNPEPEIDFVKKYKEHMK